MRATIFAIDCFGDQTFRGFTKDEHWNGWACPYFPFEQAERIAEAQKGIGLNAYYDKDLDGFAFEIEASDGEYDIFPAVETEGMQLYPVGAFCWTWEEDVSEGVAA